MLNFVAVLVSAVAIGHAEKADHARVVLPASYSAWSTVAQCESGGWVVKGDAYPDSLGITLTNYLRFGGVPQTVGRVSLRDRVRQVRVATRMIRYYHMGVPDRNGCASW